MEALPDWRVANGETLSWTLSLAAAKFKVDCSSDSPEFLDLCKTLYGRLAGDLRAVTRSICSAGDRLQDTDLQGLLEETCTEVKFIEKLSVAAGAADGICLCFMVIAILVFLLHVGSRCNNRRAWRGSFGCRVFAWLALTTSCILYSLCIRITEDLFHFQPPAGVAFDPAHAEPVGHELLYGFILAIAAAGIQGLHLLFWWKASPFDPDPYFWISPLPGGASRNAFAPSGASLTFAATLCTNSLVCASCWEAEPSNS
ncbi:hypothetical protein Efla_004369 [Eimeria flavescens]